MGLGWVTLSQSPPLASLGCLGSPTFDLEFENLFSRNQVCPKSSNSDQMSHLTWIQFYFSGIRFIKEHAKSGIHETYSPKYEARRSEIEEAPVSVVLPPRLFKPM